MTFSYNVFNCLLRFLNHCAALIFRCDCCAPLAALHPPSSSSSLSVARAKPATARLLIIFQRPKLNGPLIHCHSAPSLSLCPSLSLHLSLLRSLPESVLHFGPFLHCCCRCGWPHSSVCVCCLCGTISSLCEIIPKVLALLIILSERERETLWERERERGESG